MERKRAGEEALPYGPDPKNLDIFRVLGLTNPGRIGGSLLLGLHVLRAPSLFFHTTIHTVLAHKHSRLGPLEPI